MNLIIKLKGRSLDLLNLDTFIQYILNYNEIACSPCTDSTTAFIFLNSLLNDR